MERTTPLVLVFFQEPVTGREPVKEWIKELNKDDRKTMGHDLMFLQNNWPIGKPYVDNLGKGLWELRSSFDNRIARVLFVVKRDKIIALHAFIKKTQKTPPNEIAIALRRLKDVVY
jgi:phage-related protein